MYSHLAISGNDISILSILAPGVNKPNFVPRSYTKLYSTYLQIETEKLLQKLFFRLYLSFRGLLFHILNDIDGLDGLN